MVFLYSLIALTWAAMLLLALLIIGIIRQVNVLTAEVNQRRSTETSLLEASTYLELPDDELRFREADTTSLFVFLAQKCDRCRAILPALAERAADSPLRVAVVVLDESTGAELARDLPNVELIVSSSAYTALGVRETPSAVAVSPDGRMLAKAVLSSDRNVRGIFDSLTSTRHLTTGVSSS